MKEAIREVSLKSRPCARACGRNPSEGTEFQVEEKQGKSLPECGDRNTREASVGSLTRKQGRGHKMRSHRASQAVAGTWISTLRKVGSEPRGASLT